MDNILSAKYIIHIRWQKIIYIVDLDIVNLSTISFLFNMIFIFLPTSINPPVLF